MNVEHYTTYHFAKRSISFSHLFVKHFEPFLLSMLVLTGAVGSIYIFGQKMVDKNYPTNQTEPYHSSVSGIYADESEKNASNVFDDFIKIETKQAAGKYFNFDFLKDHKASRYVLEMGDGVRLIVTQNNLVYAYNLPGKYTIELKEIKNGLLHLLGTKKIKVK